MFMKKAINKQQKNITQYEDLVIDDLMEEEDMG